MLVPVCLAPHPFPRNSKLSVRLPVTSVAVAPCRLMNETLSNTAIGMHHGDPVVGRLFIVNQLEATRWPCHLGTIGFVVDLTKHPLHTIAGGVLNSLFPGYAVDARKL